MTEGIYAWDFRIYLNAYTKAAASQNPYQPFDIGRSFLNHPFILSFITPFAVLHNHTAAIWLWGILSLIAWLFSVTLTLHLTQHFLSADLSFLQSLFLFLLLSGFAPAVEALYLGQIDPLVLAFLLLSI